VARDVIVNEASRRAERHDASIEDGVELVPMNAALLGRANPSRHRMCRPHAFE